MVNDENMYEVDFKTYCKTCKHEDIPESKDPCFECLDYPYREGTRKPMEWEPKK